MNWLKLTPALKWICVQILKKNPINIMKSGFAAMVKAVIYLCLSKNKTLKNFFQNETMRT